MKKGFRRALAWVLGAVVLAGLGVAAARVVARWRPAEPPDQLIRRAQEAITAKDWAEAGALLDRLGDQRVRGSTVDFLRGQLEDARGRPEEALAALEKVPAEDRLAARARLLAGQIERKRDHARKAEAALLEAVRLNPGLAQARRELAFLYGIQGRRADVDAQFRSLARIARLDMNGVFLWTSSNEDILYNPLNRPILEGFLAADPDDRPSRLGLAEVLLRAGQLAECEEAVAPLPPEDPEAISLRVRVRMQRSQIDDVPALLDLGPADHPALACLRGQVALQRRQAAAAVHQYQIAERDQPTNREAVQGLAIALHTVGREAESAALRKRADALRVLAELIQDQFQNLDRGTRDPSLPRRLGAACEAVGREDVARAWYQIALGSAAQAPSPRETVDRPGRSAIR